MEIDMGQVDLRKATLVVDNDQLTPTSAVLVDGLLTKILFMMNGKNCRLLLTSEAKHNLKSGKTMQIGTMFAPVAVSKGVVAKLNEKVNYTIQIFDRERNGYNLVKLLPVEIAKPRVRMFKIF